MTAAFLSVDWEYPGSFEWKVSGVKWASLPVTFSFEIAAVGARDDGDDVVMDKGDGGAGLGV